jgi:ubiquitin-protein ligase E3 A
LATPGLFFCPKSIIKILNFFVHSKIKKEFVDLYADFILNKGIEESFKAFRRGFLKIVMNSPLIRWYTPEELEILLCGTKV